VLGPEEVSILKNAICRGATDTELQYCLAVARRHRLDPFRQEVWFVMRWDSQALSTDGKKGAHVWVPVVGINGLLHVAARDHREYGSYSEPEYGPMVDVEWYDKDNRKRTLKAPEWCRVEAWKKGCARPTVAKVWWNEIYPDVDKAPLVRQMPRLMLAKCAKAQATRTAYPATGGLLTDAETYGREFEEITPQGRVISRTAPEPDRGQADAKLADALTAYHEREKQQIVEELARLTLAQREALEKKLAEAQTVKAAAPAAEPTKDRAKAAVEGSQSAEAAPPRAKAGDEGPQGGPSRAQGSPGKAHEAAKPPATKPGPKPAQEPEKPTRAVIPEPPQTIKGPADMILPGSTSKGSEYREIHVKGLKLFLFDNQERLLADGRTKVRLFDVLDATPLGDPVEAIVETRIAAGIPRRKIVNLLRAGDHEWEPDGTPVIRRDARTSETEGGLFEATDDDIPI
jgi:RecT family